MLKGGVNPNPTLAYAFVFGPFYITTFVSKTLTLCVYVFHFPPCDGRIRLTSYLQSVTTNHSVPLIQSLKLSADRLQ